MIPLLLFLLACAALYVGTVQTAFSVLMRLPLRLNAERHGQPGLLGHYLEEPARLFVTAGLLQAVTVALVTTLALLLVEPGGPGVWLGFVGLVVFALACGHVLPLLVVRRSPERVLTVLLPSFHAVARVLRPVTGALADRLSGGPPGAAGRARGPRRTGRPARTTRRRTGSTPRSTNARSGSSCSRWSSSATRWCAR